MTTLPRMSDKAWVAPSTSGRVNPGAALGGVCRWTFTDAPLQRQLQHYGTHALCILLLRLAGAIDPQEATITQRCLSGLNYDARSGVPARCVPLQPEAVTPKGVGYRTSARNSHGRSIRGDWAGACEQNVAIGFGSLWLSLGATCWVIPG